jgi:transposase
MLPKEYARSALMEGLRQEEKLGANPFKFGMVGSTDAHTGLVVDNCPTHHGRFGPVLRDYLAQQGIEVLYTPTYSPEFNPAEYAFKKNKNACQTKSLQRHDGHELRLYNTRISERNFF